VFTWADTFERLGLLAALTALTFGCAAPTLSQEGQLVFSQSPRHGATVLTANGVEFMDRGERPAPVVRKSAFEPWRPPTGFLLPADGVLTATSKPVSIEDRGVRVVLRASDALVPSWGGEILVRLDAIVPIEAHPEAAGSLRAPVRVAIVLDTDDDEAVPLVEDLLDAVGTADRVTVVDASGAIGVVPMVPGTHHALLAGAVDRRLAVRHGVARRSLWRALAKAEKSLGPRGARRLLVISDGLGVAKDRARVQRAATALAAKGVGVAAVGSNAAVDAGSLAPLASNVGVGDERARVAAVEALLRPPGDAVVGDLELSFSSAPAPLRLLEASSGEIASTLDDERLSLGDLSVGEARTEVVRLGVPDWQPGDEYRLRVRVSYSDVDGREHAAEREIRMLYSDDIEAIAHQRRGDVIAYASALAMVRRLERAFLGSAADRVGGLEGLIRWQARSLRTLARTRHDAWLAGEVGVLDSLLDALGPG
jgi:hypothetical protein